MVPLQVKQIIKLTKLDWEAETKDQLGGLFTHCKIFFYI